MTTGLPWTPPDYDGACLTQVLPSALAMLEGRTGALTLPSADRVVLLLIDGLGLDPGPTPDFAPFLSAMTPLLPAGIDVAFPSTTATSITSLGTGLSPGVHGLVGMSFWLPEFDQVLYPLGWRERPPAQSVQPERTVFQRAAAAGIAVTVVQHRNFTGSGLTQSALRGGRHVGADSLGETVVALAGAAADHPPGLVYGYFGDVDKSGHVHGVGSEQWCLDLWHVDRSVEQLASRLPRGTVLLVTGDHGMINCPDDERVDIDVPELAQGVRKVAGEPRMRHVYVHRPAETGAVAARWADCLGGAAVVLTKRAAVDAGLFGQVRHDMAGRIGDVLALPTGTGVLASQADAVVSGLRGQHGGLTQAERKVPLLSWVA